MAQPPAQQSAPPASGKSWDDLGFMEKMDVTRWVLEHFALGLIVLVRHKPGYRTLEATRLLLIAAAICVVGYLFSLSPSSYYQNTPLGSLITSVVPLPSPLPCYALAVLLVGFWKRRNRWQALKKGERWHSRSSGISYLLYLPIWRFFPPAFFAENRLQRIVEPIFYYILGFLIMALLSPALGLWLELSALGLLALEAKIYEQALNEVLDTLDGLTESEIHQENVKYFSGKNTNMLSAPAKLRELEDTAGIPTGIGVDIAAQVEKRRMRDVERMAEQAKDESQEPKSDSGDTFNA